MGNKLSQNSTAQLCTVPVPEFDNNQKYFAFAIEFKMLSGTELPKFALADTKKPVQQSLFGGNCNS